MRMDSLTCQGHSGCSDTKSVATTTVVVTRHHCPHHLHYPHLLGPFRACGPPQCLGRPSFSLPGPSSGLPIPISTFQSKRSAANYSESFFKRTIPFVMLQLDELGKIAVESTIDNVYVKIPGKRNVSIINSIVNC